MSPPTRRSLLRTTAVGAAAGLAGCSVLAGSSPDPLPDATPGADDWPMIGYDARNTRHNADATPPRTDPGRRWTHEFRFCHDPVVRGDRVVLNAEGDDREHTFGLRASDGTEAWRSTARPWGYPTPALGRERAYVTGPDCAFGIALDDGAETWRGSPCHGANTASGTVADGRLYLEYGGYLSALDARGEVTWATAQDAGPAPAILGGTAYVATAFVVAALDLGATARELPWEDRDDDEPPHAEADAATLWSEPPEPSTVLAAPIHPPVVRHGHVYATFQGEAPGGELRALDRGSGEERWTVAAPPGHRPEAERNREDAPDPVADPVAPVVTNNRVVTSLGDRVVRAFTPTGDAEWTTTLSGNVSELAAGGETLLALAHDRDVERTAPDHAVVVALDLGTGDRLWERTYENHVSGLAVAGDGVYLTTVIERTADDGVGGERLVALA